MKKEIDINDVVAFLIKDEQNIDKVEQVLNLAKKNLERKETSNVDLQNIFNLSVKTQNDWKSKDLEDWRKRVHLFLKSFTKEELESRVREILVDEKGCEII